MHPFLALELSTTVLVIVGVVSVVLLVLIIVAPWRQVREEPPLDPAVEARLLLHRDPDDVTGEVPRIVGSAGEIGDAAPAGNDGAGVADLAELDELRDLPDEEGDPLR